MKLYAHPALTPEQRRLVEIYTGTICNAHGELIPKGIVQRLHERWFQRKPTTPPTSPSAA